jgi:hypothetical protein
MLLLSQLTINSYSASLEIPEVKLIQSYQHPATMSLFRKAASIDTDTDTLIPQVQWIPYRENGKVKYMRSDDEELRNFSPTGRGANISKPSAYANMTTGSGFVANAPQFLPERYTDNSLIPAIVTNVILSTKPKPKPKPDPEEYVPACHFVGWGISC